MNNLTYSKKVMASRARQKVAEQLNLFCFSFNSCFILLHYDAGVKLTGPDQSYRLREQCGSESFSLLLKEIKVNGVI